MPIRFRCRYCNQLMGIARRKAGTLVHCPTCHAQVLVPQADTQENPQPPPAPPIASAPAPLFERSDFEAFLDNPAPQAQPSPGPPAPASPAATFAAAIPSSPALSSAPSRARMPGVFLSPGQATWLTIVVILLVALAFGAGLLVGHYWIG